MENPTLPMGLTALWHGARELRYRWKRICGLGHPGTNPGDRSTRFRATRTGWQPHPDEVELDAGAATEYGGYAERQSQCGGELRSTDAALLAGTPTR